MHSTEVYHGAAGRLAPIDVVAPPRYCRGCYRLLCRRSADIIEDDCSMREASGPRRQRYRDTARFSAFEGPCSGYRLRWRALRFRRDFDAAA